MTPWRELCALIEPICPKPGKGQRPVGQERMKRIYLLRRWLGPLGPGAEGGHGCGHGAGPVSSIGGRARYATRCGNECVAKTWQHVRGGSAWQKRRRDEGRERTQNARRIVLEVLEAESLSGWLHAGIIVAWFPAVLMETRHVKAALKAMTGKTDRNDVYGAARLIRAGWFRPVHAKTPPEGCARKKA